MNGGIPVSRQQSLPPSVSKRLVELMSSVCEAMCSSVYQKHSLVTSSFLDKFDKYSWQFGVYSKQGYLCEFIRLMWIKTSIGNRTEVLF